ncbi:hypothetical protein D3C78_1406310 [compost metagenome]
MLLVAVFPLHGDLEEALGQVGIALPAFGRRQGAGQQQGEQQAQHPAWREMTAGSSCTLSPWDHGASLQAVWVSAGLARYHAR